MSAMHCENKQFKMLTEKAAKWHSTNATGADHLRLAYINDFDEEARRYQTELGGALPQPSAIPEIYSCKRVDYEPTVVLRTEKTDKYESKDVIAACYFDPWWFCDSNRSANTAFFILSAIMDAANSARKIEAYNYAHLLCLEADATRNPLGYGFIELKKIASSTKDIHGKIFTSAWNYLDSKRFVSTPDQYQLPKTNNFDTPLCTYREQNSEAAEGMVFGSSLFVKGDHPDVMFFEALGNLKMQQPEGYEEREGKKETDDWFTRWKTKNGDSNLPFDPDHFTKPPLNNDLIARADDNLDTPEPLTKDHLDFKAATTYEDASWKTYWLEANTTNEAGLTIPAADGTDDTQKKKYLADACFNAFKDAKASSRKLEPVQWSQGYFNAALKKDELALLYLEARCRSDRGFRALAALSAHTTNPEGLHKSNNNAFCAKIWAEYAQIWLKEECIEFDANVSKNHHEEPLMCGGKVLVVWRYGKEGPYPTMLKDVFTHKGTRRVDEQADAEDVGDNHDLNQAQRGHFMMLGRFPGVVDNSPSGIEASNKFGETFWIMNKSAPSGMISRWIPNGKGGVENVWLSDAKDAKVEAERAYAGDRPPYYLNKDLDTERAMAPNIATGEFLSEARKENKNAYKMPPLQVWVKDEHGTPVERDSTFFKDSGNYYPSVINPASRIPNPTVIASVAHHDVVESDPYSGDYSYSGSDASF